MATIHTLIDEWAAIGPAAWAQDSYGWILETGEPVTLTPWQIALLAELEARRGQVSSVLISTVKKSGKTTFASLILCYRWLTIPASLHYAVGNDLAQAEELQFNIVAKMCERHPILRRYTKITRDTILFKPTGSRIVSLPYDASSAAGANFASVSFSELWGYRYEAGERLYEELTPIPLVDCVRLVDSYAGFERESLLLQRIWDRGLSGDCINDEWPIFLTGQQLSYIHTGIEAQVRCWRGADAIEREAYYAEQRASLREGSYRRLHLNEWASSESAFISPEAWDALIQPGYVCPGPDKSIHLYAAIDAAVKNDNAACVTTHLKDNLPHLGPFRIWRPNPQIDLEAIENYVLQLASDFNLVACGYDPYQMAHIAQRLEKRGVKMVEFPQTVDRMTHAGSNLFDLIQQSRLIIYNAPELRTHVLNAVAKETPRGLRLIKDNVKRKIDAAIALAMSCVGAMEGHQWATMPSFLALAGTPGNADGQGNMRVISGKDTHCPQCHTALKPKRSAPDELTCPHCGFEPDLGIRPAPVLRLS